MKLDEAVTDEVIAIARHFGAFERETICCGTVTVPQCVALQLLLDGPLDVGQLATRMGGSASATTRLVDGLVKRGSVRRVEAADDKRRVTVELTPEGTTEAAGLRDVTVQGVCAILDHVPRGKRAQLLESLRLLRGALEKGKAALACCVPSTRR